MEILWAYIVMFALFGSVFFALAGIVCGIMQDRLITNTNYGDTIKAVTGSKNDYYEHYAWLQSQKRKWFIISIVCILIIVGTGYIKDMKVAGTITFQGE